MLASDVDELDRLLHPELLAVGRDGRTIDKAEDLASHRAGVFKISELNEEEVRVRVLGDMALTFVALRIRGTIDEAEISGRMRNTGTWTRDGGTWRVVGAHISSVAALRETRPVLSPSRPGPRHARRLWSAAAAASLKRRPAS
jgi:ketosteroid isomerase-like protein